MSSPPLVYDVEKVDPITPNTDTEIPIPPNNPHHIRPNDAPSNNFSHLEIEDAVLAQQLQDEEFARHYSSSRPHQNNRSADTTMFQNTFPHEVETTSAIPPCSLNGLTIASIILAVCGIGLGLGAGAYTTASHDESNSRRGNDTMMAVFLGLLGIAAFATSIPLLACGARQYQSKRGSKGAPVLMIIAWIAYSLSLAAAVLLLFSSVLAGYVTPAWVYLAILCNVVPFFIMLGHAECARRR